jgi:hypothetical protein
MNIYDEMKDSLILHFVIKLLMRMNDMAFCRIVVIVVRNIYQIIQIIKSFACVASEIQHCNLNNNNNKNNNKLYYYIIHSLLHYKYIYIIFYYYIYNGEWDHNHNSVL